MPDDARPAEAEAGAGVQPPAPQPLPTPEESLREIEQEAAQKQTEIREDEAKKQMEVHAARYEERVKFRDELRAALKEFGREAAPEIERLCQRYSYDKDPVRLALASSKWRFARLSLAAKVKIVRELDLPESAILDFLSDDLHLQVRGRNGPRNENEVRIRAAQQLLKFELPPLEMMQWRQPDPNLMDAGLSRGRTAPPTNRSVQRGRQ
jgi:hypothetical protein